MRLGQTKKAHPVVRLIILIRRFSFEPPQIIQQTRGQRARTRWMQTNERLLSACDAVPEERVFVLPYAHHFATEEARAGNCQSASALAMQSHNSVQCPMSNVQCPVFNLQSAICNL